jgi:hypothetical protein
MVLMRQFVRLYSIQINLLSTTHLLVSKTNHFLIMVIQSSLEISSEPFFPGWEFVATTNQYKQALANKIVSLHSIVSPNGVPSGCPLDEILKSTKSHFYTVNFRSGEIAGQQSRFSGTFSSRLLEISLP